MQYTLFSLALFGTMVWADETASSTSSSSTGTATSSDSSTITGSSTVPTVGASTNGPAEVAFKYCFPSKFPSIATDTPCYSMEVLNQACFYGPSVFQTATATPTATASPKDQQSCYCNEASGVGFMYFQYMEGCSNCFREHGALGSYGAYNKEFISSLSSSYCHQPSATKNFGQFLTSFQANKVTPTADASTSNILGTSTDVSLYYTTRLVGGFANGTANGTAAGTGTGRTGGTALPTGGYNATTTNHALGTGTAPLTTTTESSGNAAPAATTSASTSSSAGAGSHIQATGFIGAFLLGIAALL